MMDSESLGRQVEDETYSVEVGVEIQIKVQ